MDGPSPWESSNGSAQAIAQRGGGGGGGAPVTFMEDDFSSYADTADISTQLDLAKWTIAGETPATGGRITSGKLDADRAAEGADVTIGLASNEIDVGGDMFIEALGDFQTQFNNDVELTLGIRYTQKTNSIPDGAADWYEFQFQPENGFASLATLKKRTASGLDTLASAVALGIFSGDIKLCRLEFTNEGANVRIKVFVAGVLKLNHLDDGTQAGAAIQTGGFASLMLRASTVRTPTSRLQASDFKFGSL